jgi:hypothetical protein
MSWIFQAVRNRYDLRTELRPGKRDVWLVTRYGDQMQRGDVVYLWQAGAPEIRGIYGWGRIERDGAREYKDGAGIPVAYEAAFSPHVRASEVEQLSEMQDHLLFRMPIGTNFPLAEVQDRAVRRLIQDLLKVRVPGD